MLKQILTVAVVDSKLLKVCQEKKPMLLWALKTTLERSTNHKGQVWLLDIFQTCTKRKKQKNPLYCAWNSHMLNAYNAHRLSIKYSLVIAAFIVKAGIVNKTAKGAPSVTDTGSNS